MRSGFVQNGGAGFVPVSRAAVPLGGAQAQPLPQSTTVMHRGTKVAEAPMMATHASPTDTLDKLDMGGIGDLAIPIEHTTAAHKLLRWASIQELVHPVTENEQYVMQGEQKRGLLRVWGRGEGGDAPDGNPLSLVIYPDGPSAEEASRRQYGSSHLENLWGNGLPPVASSEIRRPAVDSIGGLNPDGSLKIDGPTLAGLLGSYMKNIHIMHPILDPERISAMVYAFAHRYQTSPDGHPRSPFAAPSHIMSEFRRDSATGLHKGNKRKRSSVGMPNPSPASSCASSACGRVAPERSIASALVLLVAALGKICEHKDFLPGPVPDVMPEAERRASLMDLPHPYATISPAVSNKHSPVSSPSSGMGSAASPQDTSRLCYGGRRASMDTMSPVYRSGSPINADVIPGLAYYAHATDILGNLHGGNELPHVQAGLLAGLYAGQLGRVLESWKWINWACIGCQVLVQRYTWDELDKVDPIRIAFWTCLQLER